MAQRVTELSHLLKITRDELEEHKSLLERKSTTVTELQDIVSAQESTIIEQTAQLQAQNAEIRALRRQHTLDAEELRATHTQGKRCGCSTTLSLPSPADAGPAQAVESALSPSRRQLGSPNRPLRQQLKQTINDKLVLVRALHQLTSEHAQATQRRPTQSDVAAQARRPSPPPEPAARARRPSPLMPAPLSRVRELDHALRAGRFACAPVCVVQLRAELSHVQVASQRSLETAWRMGQLGQLGLALLEMGDEEGAAGALGALDGPEGSDPRSWDSMMEATKSSPPTLPPYVPSEAALPAESQAVEVLSYEQQQAQQALQAALHFMSEQRSLPPDAPDATAANAAHSAAGHGFFPPAEAFGLPLDGVWEES